MLVPDESQLGSDSCCGELITTDMKRTNVDGQKDRAQSRKSRNHGGMRIADAALLGLGCVVALVAGLWSSSGDTTQHAAPTVSGKEATSSVLEGLCMYAAAAFVVASVLLGIYTDSSAPKGAFQFVIVGIFAVVISTVPAAPWAAASILIGCGGTWTGWRLGVKLFSQNDTKLPRG